MGQKSREVLDGFGIGVCWRLPSRLELTHVLPNPDMLKATYRFLGSSLAEARELCR